VVNSFSKAVYMLNFRNGLEDILYHALMGVIIGTGAGMALEIAQGRFPWGYVVLFVGASLVARRWTRKLKINEI
jgi:hypothetical protein